jgi:PAS domain S-box-containing protein
MMPDSWEIMLIMTLLLALAVVLILYLVFGKNGTRKKSTAVSDLDTLFEQQPEAWVIMDGISGVAIKANQKAMNLFGVYRQNYLSKLRFSGMFSEELSNDEAALLLDAVDNNTFVNKILECRGIQGRTFRVVVSISRIQEGNLFCRFAEPLEQAIPVPEPSITALPSSIPDKGVQEDISHLQETPSALVQTNEEDQRTLVVPDAGIPTGAIAPLAADAIAVIGNDQSFIEVNALFAALTGYEISELKSLSFDQLVHPSESSLHQSWFAELADGRYRVARAQRKLIARDGHQVLLELLGASMPSRKAVILTALDNSRRHEEFQLLMRSRDNLSALIENTAEAVFSLDALGRITVINNRYRELFKMRYGRELKEGQEYEEVISTEERKSWKDKFRRVLQGYREVYREEFSAESNDKLTVEVLLYPVRDESGLITGITYSGRDISERLVQEKALQEAKEKAEQATKAKSDFLAVMSHEIRTPLNGLMGITGLLDNTGLNTEQKEFVDIIRLSGEALLQVIGDILDFSKIEANRMQLELAPFRIADAVKETLDILSGRARDKGLNLQSELGQDLPEYVTGDKARLRQILMNLAGNAIKFTDKGQILIRVRKIKTGPGELELEFAVQDSGIGIDPVQAERLFMPYSQADASTYRQFGGTGLGLAICRNLVDLMGGKIWVESQPGKGSTFFFTIRVQQSDYHKVSEAVSPSDGMLTPKEKAVSLLSEDYPVRILIAEDNDINRLLAVKLFERLGYKADAVPNGKLAYDAVLNGEYDLVFMDVQMPEMDGYDSTRAIRSALKITTQPAIIAMTAFAGEKEKNTCLEAGMNDHISKPIMLDDLEIMIRRWADIKANPMKQTVKSTTEAGTTETPVLDQGALQRLMDIGKQTDPGFLQQILDMFMKQAPQNINEIREALERGDFNTLWKSAHKLKGTCLNIGASRLGDLCRSIEKKGKGLEISGLQSLCMQLEPAYQVTVKELKGMFEYN